MKRVFYWLVDYFYLLRGLLTMLTNKNPPGYFLNAAIKGKAPVILISGIYNKWGFLKHLGDKISHSGHPVYVVDKLGLNLFDIPASAKIVREIIDKNNLGNVVIVGHSKGGLIGKYLLVHENKDNKIKKLIAIAAPFSGSRLADKLPGKPIKELSLTSKIIQSLNSRKEINSKIISLMPAFDNHVWSDKGSYLEGAINIKFPTKGHHKILFEKKAIQKIIELIEKFK